MSKMQDGFGTVEVIVILAILTLLSGTAYYVGTKHSNKSASNHYSTTAKSATKDNLLTTSKISTFKFANLGIQFTLPSSISDLQYTPQAYNDGGKGGYLTTTSIDNLIKQCTAGQSNDTSSFSFAGIGKLDGQYDPNKVEEGQLLKQFNSFYIIISYPNGIRPCYPDQNAMSQLKSQEGIATDTFTKAFQATATESH